MSTASIPVLTPPSQLILSTLERFQALIDPHLEGEAAGVVLDLADVSFVNSAGLGCLVKAGMQLDRQGRRLALACPQRAVESTLRLVGLDSMLPLFKSVDEATHFVRRQSQGPA